MTNQEAEAIGHADAERIFLGGLEQTGLSPDLQKPFASVYTSACNLIDAEGDYPVTRTEISRSRWVSAKNDFCAASQVLCDTVKKLGVSDAVTSVEILRKGAIAAGLHSAQARAALDALLDLAMVAKAQGLVGDDTNLRPVEFPSAAGLSDGSVSPRVAKAMEAIEAFAGAASNILDGQSRYEAYRKHGETKQSEQPPEEAPCTELEWGEIAKTLKEKAQPVLSLFAKYRVDASSVIQFLSDVDCLRLSFYVTEAAANSALKNLSLQVMTDTTIGGLKVTAKDVEQLAEEIVRLVSELRVVLARSSPMQRTTDSQEVAKRKSDQFQEWWAKLTEVSADAQEYCEILTSLLGPGLCTGMREWVKIIRGEYGLERNPHDDKQLAIVIDEALAIGRNVKQRSSNTPTKAAAAIVEPPPEKPTKPPREAIPAFIQSGLARLGDKAKAAENGNEEAIATVRNVLGRNKIAAGADCPRASVTNNQAFKKLQERFPFLRERSGRGLAGGSRIGMDVARDAIKGDASDHNRETLLRHDKFRVDLAPEVDASTIEQPPTGQDDREELEELLMAEQRTKLIDAPTATAFLSQFDLGASIKTIRSTLEMVRDQKADSKRQRAGR